jgi:hypothetical protein
MFRQSRNEKRLHKPQKEWATGRHIAGSRGGGKWGDEIRTDADISLFQHSAPLAPLLVG